jgi:hypothetical protein
MSRAARSILVFGVYLTAVGLGLLFVPNVLLTTLRLPPSAEIWPRILGVVTLVLAYYYVMAARSELTGFFRWTVTARILVFVVFGVLVLAGLAPIPVALLGAVDLAAAVWTGLSLRKSLG